LLQDIIALFFFLKKLLVPTGKESRFQYNILVAIKAKPTLGLFITR
jgi:hypothetical protein